ncbi:TRASH domain-containing protein [Bdellovibrio bacteriovorus]|nr:TRASH domain-containing protein [Bdellovibrio bacteriovorus]
MKFLIAFAMTFLFSVIGFASSWKIVPNKEVCMVNETHFARPQIAVPVGGKTYYGCCENCKKTLSENQSARTAKDALTGKTVDKANAVIAANPAGNVLYFENKKNFEQFVKRR